MLWSTRGPLRTGSRPCGPEDAVWDDSEKLAEVHACTVELRRGGLAVNTSGIRGRSAVRLNRGAASRCRSDFGLA